MCVSGLLEAMRSTYPAGHRLVWQCLENHANGARWWAMTEQQIAEELHLSPATVRRAIADLTRDRIIRVVRCKRRPTTFHMLRRYEKTRQNDSSTDELSRQNESSTWVFEEDATPQNDSSTAELTPQNAEPTGELTRQNDSSLTQQKTPTEEVPTSRSVALRTPRGEMPDATRDLWQEGLPILIDLTGLPTSRCRGMLGKLKGMAGENSAIVLDALREAANVHPLDAYPWLIRAIEQRLGRDPMKRDPAKLTGAALASWRIRQEREALARQEAQP